ncbi:polysaccharide biosynthesis tyrosine autokinase [Peribacillus saganii]|uniref:non-specific protein-tyrosine kinase n=1 Tax=Peribacillus saganii TaxID=2303992 RepID=A0A372LKF6_9BACI|nr:CpsD/CapB family tyrosine-protein kinase [Peribacillus saganii]RFU67115.1 polysaccharide biosynthesis tyrosine autokinase [Peribacillus saganii]
MAFRSKQQSKKSNNRTLITHINSKSPISEQYKTIRTNIQFSSLDEDIRSLVVTSSGPGEGKSTTVGNLAVVFAQQGKRVLLIDADMRKPTAHYTFRKDNITGLTNVLTRQAALDKAVSETDIENLYILTSGPIPPNPAELLSSHAMDELLESAMHHFDMVLFDTPPVLAVTDAQILASKCNGTILVVKSNYTATDAAVKAKELLSAAQAKLLGVVLNAKKLKESNYYYYYGK